MNRIAEPINFITRHVHAKPGSNDHVNPKDNFIAEKTSCNNDWLRAIAKAKKKKRFLERDLCPKSKKFVFS